MAKPRRTVLSGIVTPLQSAGPAEARAARRRRSATIQQTLYLPPAVHDQLRELAFAKRVKMHSLILEGLDAVFRANGMKSIAELADKLPL